MNTIIIDDEKQIREGLTILLSNYSYIKIVDEASSVEEGVVAIEKHQPDLLFLDIQLKSKNAFDLLKTIKYQDFKLIFITAYNQYAIKAFKFNAFDYLLKPIDPDELNQTLGRLKEEKNYTSEQIKQLDNNDKLEKISIKTTQQLFVLNIKDIIRCEASKGYTFFYVKNQKRILSSKTLKEYDQMLQNEGFIRVHQSHLVNIKYIEGIKNYNIITEDQYEVPVSVRKRKEVNQIMKKLSKKNT